jgi:sulfur-oxidizing protein SoxX
LRATAAGIVTSLAMFGCATPTARDAVGIAEKAFEVADVARGRELIAGRDGNCLLCHTIAATGARFMGNIGPALDGIGARMNVAELRERVADPVRFNPDTIMPAYARTSGLKLVGESWRGKPILDARQIDDVATYLATLK